MSLTRSFGVFASANQDAVNSALTTVFTVRPHYLHYGSTPFVGASSVTVTQMAPIAFPGVPGGIPWAVDFSIPVVDLFPADATLPPPLTLAPGQLAVSTDVTITLGCVHGDPKGDNRGHVQPVKTTLTVVAIGHPVARYFSPGVGDVSFVVDQVLVEGVKPTSLEQVLECLVRMLLDAVLAQVHLPFDVIGADFFKLVLQAGPAVEDDQIKMWGDVA